MKISYDVRVNRIRMDGVRTVALFERKLFYFSSYAMNFRHQECFWDRI